MVTVSFDAINSSTHLGLFLTEVKIEEPEPKRTVVDVPCRDGELDLTYALSSSTHYKNRKIKMVFKKTDYTNTWMTVFSNVANALHGKRMSVSFSNDAAWAWDCFVTVEPESEYNVGTIEVNCDAFPYKQKTVTLTTTATGAGASVSAAVSAKPVTPEVTCVNNIMITTGGETYSFEAGTSTDPNMVLPAGTNTLVVKGSGAVTINYTDWSL